MKYLRQENNRFIFEDGGERFVLFESPYDDFYEYEDSDVAIRKDLSIKHKNYSFAYIGEIQTAVQMMTILKEKGLV